MVKQNENIYRKIQIRVLYRKERTKSSLLVPAACELRTFGSMALKEQSNLTPIQTTSI